jgi:hypothetical protein
MAHSSLLGIERANAEARGRDTAALGPSDTSDSGSDLVGIEDFDVDDPSAPVDSALGEDAERQWTTADSMSGSSSDAAGTGEGRSAAGDAGGREAADISPDRIIGGNGEDDEDPDLAFIDEAEAGDPLDEEDEESDDEDSAGDADPGDSGRTHKAGTSGAVKLRASGSGHAPGHAPTLPGRRNPDPDLPTSPEPVEGEDDEVPGGEEDENETHRPGRA